MQSGDLVIIGGAILVRLDREFNETVIASGGYLTDARGVAIGRDGQIFVTAHPCGKGGVVSIDPYSGTQTPIAFGFRTSMGIVLETGGKSLLVGDENPDPGAGRWGQLVRIDLNTREQFVLANLPATNAARGIAVHPESNDIYVADSTLNRLDHLTNELTQIEINDLDNAVSVAIDPSGNIFVGEHHQGKLLWVKRGQRAPIAVSRQIGGSLCCIALSNDNKTLYAAGTADSGYVYKIGLPFDNRTEPVRIWKGRRGPGVAVAVAMVR